MKKFIFLFVLAFINIGIVNASDKITVTFDKCVDGDTAYFYLNNEELKCRFLAIDTPESTTTVEEYGKKASSFTCNLLEGASIIEIEYDDNSDKTDKYDRELVWVFVDGKLLQNLIVKEGLGEVAYLYGDYKYTYILEESQKIAKENKLNIWSDEDNTINDYWYYIGLGIVFVLFLIFNKSFRNSFIKKIQKKIFKAI